MKGEKGKQEEQVVRRMLQMESCIEELEKGQEWMGRLRELLWMLPGVRQNDSHLKLMQEQIKALQPHTLKPKDNYYHHERTIVLTESQLPSLQHDLHTIIQNNNRSPTKENISLAEKLGNRKQDVQRTVQVEIQKTRSALSCLQQQQGYRRKRSHFEKYESMVGMLSSISSWLQERKLKQQLMEHPLQQKSQEQNVKIKHIHQQLSACDARLKNQHQQLMKMTQASKFGFIWWWERCKSFTYRIEGLIQWYEDMIEGVHANGGGKQAGQLLVYFSRMKEEWKQLEGRLLSGV